MASLPLKNITRLIQKTQKNLERRGGSEGYAEIKNYSAIWNEDAQTLRLLHYGTPILQTTGDNIDYLGGWSNSDRDAINSALMVLGIDAKVSGAQEAPSSEYKRLDGWWVKGI